MIEQLESRIAPAATLTFFEADGDKITVKTSRGNSDLLEAMMAIVPGSEGITHIDLDFLSNPAYATAFAGTDITISASGKGDKLANFVTINAFDGSNANSIDLGKVKIKGTLVKIDAGDAELTTPAIKSLDVTKMGRASGISNASTSEIHGNITTVKIKEDFSGCFISKDVNGTANYTLPEATAIGSFSADTIATQNGDDIGHVQVGSIGKLTVKTVFQGGAGGVVRCGLFEAQDIRSLNIARIGFGARIALVS